MGFKTVERTGKQDIMSAQRYLSSTNSSPPGPVIVPWTVYLVSAVLLVGFIATALAKLSDGPALLAGLTVGIVYGLWILKPTHALAIYLAVLLLTPAAMLGILLPGLGILTLHKALMLPMILLGILMMLKRGRMRIPLVLPVSLFYSIALLTVLLNLDTMRQAEISGAVRFLIQFAEYFLLFYYVVNFIRREQVSGIITVLLVCVGLLALSGLAEAVLNIRIMDYFSRLPIPIKEETLATLQIYSMRSGFTRVHSVFFNAIEYGVVLVLFWPLAFIMSRQARNHIVKLSLIAVSVLCIISSLLTLSRGVLVCLLIEVLFVMLLTYRGRKRIWLVILGCLALPLVVYAMSQALTIYFPEGVQTDETVQYRLSVLAFAPILTLRTHPFLGFGYGVIPQGLQRNFENFYVLAMTASGLVGLITFLILLGSVTLYLMRASYKMHDATMKGIVLSALVASVGFAAMNLFFDAFSFMITTKLFFVIVALGIVASRPALHLRESDATREHR